MPFSHSINRVSKTLELIYKDVWGPSPICSINRFKYYVSFLDAFTHYTWLFPIYRKSDVYATFKQFQLHVERLFDCKIKIIQSDWGGEYHSLQKFLQSLGIHHRLSCSHTRQQNGAIERKHCHIIETALALLSHAHIPLKHWDDAFLTACYLINRLPTPLFNHTTPYKAPFHSPPNYSLLKVFGCACWPNLRPYNSNKLQPRSFRCVFLGYNLIHKGYKCLHISLGWVYISRDKKKYFHSILGLLQLFQPLPHSMGFPYSLYLLFPQAHNPTQILLPKTHKILLLPQIPSTLLPSLILPRLHPFSPSLLTKWSLVPKPTSPNPKFSTMVLCVTLFLMRCSPNLISPQWSRPAIRLP